MIFTWSGVLSDVKATQDFAHHLAPFLLPGDVVALWGDLGAGKTTFARALIQALGADKEGEVPSPTFTLVQIYDGQGLQIWHFDLYRLRHPEEVTELGWEEALASGISLIEWPERLGALLPKNRLDIRLEYQRQGRRIMLEGYGSCIPRLKKWMPTT